MTMKGPRNILNCLIQVQQYKLKGDEPFSPSTYAVISDMVLMGHAIIN